MEPQTLFEQIAANKLLKDKVTYDLHDDIPFFGTVKNAIPDKTKPSHKIAANKKGPLAPDKRMEALRNVAEMGRVTRKIWPSRRDERPNRPYITTCIFCLTNGLKWGFIGGECQLISKNGEAHNCPIIITRYRGTLAKLLKLCSKQGFEPYLDDQNNICAMSMSDGARVALPESLIERILPYFYHFGSVLAQRRGHETARRLDVPICNDLDAAIDDLVSRRHRVWAENFGHFPRTIAREIMQTIKNHEMNTKPKTIDK